MPRSTRLILDRVTGAAQPPDQNYGLRRALEPSDFDADELVTPFVEVSIGLGSR